MDILIEIETIKEFIKYLVYDVKQNDYSNKFPICIPFKMVWLQV